MDIKEQAKQDYKDGMAMADIAIKYGKSAGTIRSWKSRENWDGTPKEQKAKADETKRNKDNATLQRNTATQRNDVATPILSDEAIEKLNDSDLRDKHQAFVIEYMKNFNATQAYLNVYDVQYSTAMSEGSKLLRNPKVKEMIAELRKDKLSAMSITKEDLIADLVIEAKADIGDFVDFGAYDELVQDSDGNVELDTNDEPIIKHRSWTQVKDKAKVDTRAIKKITMGKDGLNIELHDRSRARNQVLEMLLSDEGKVKAEDTNPFEGMSKSEIREVLRGQ